MCVNAQVGIEVVLGRQIKNAVFSELSEIEAESLRDAVMQDAIDVIFAIAFIGGISLNFVTLSTLTVLFFLKVFHYMCDFRQESVCFLLRAPPFLYIIFMFSFLCCFCASMCTEQNKTQQMQQDINVDARMTKKLGVMMVLLVLVDFGVTVYFGQDYIAKPTPSTLFVAFQFALLFLDALHLCGKAALALVDYTLGSGWDQRPKLTLYIEVAHALLVLVAVLVFTCLMLAKHKNTPWFLVRLAWGAFKEFRKKLDLLLKYWRAVGAIDRRFPLVELQDLPEHDPTCAICMEDMAAGRLLPCGHIIHEKCLQSWLTRQDRCPICQHPVTSDHPARLADTILAQARENRTRRLSPAPAAPSAAPASEQQQQQQPPPGSPLPATVEDVNRLIEQLREYQRHISRQSPPAPAPPSPEQAAAGAQAPEQEDPAPPSEDDVAEVRRRRLAALRRSSDGAVGGGP